MGLRASGEPTRLRVLALLSQGELTVSELTRILGQSQPRVSRHLKLLCDAGLVTRIPEGAWAFYRLADAGGCASLAGALTGLLPAGDETLLRDNSRLTGIKRERAVIAAGYFSKNAPHWDQIRSLHIAETEVEAALRDLLGNEPVEHLLDLGTGTGRILLLLKDLARRGTGIDFSREMLAIARANLERAGLTNYQVRLGEVQSLPLADATVDLVSMHLVLHYLDTPLLAIREAARVLKQNGRILIVDFAPHTLEQLRQKHAYRRLGFTELEVAGWCAQAGLGLLQVRHLPPATADGLTVLIWLAQKQGGASAGESATVTRRELAS